MSSDEIKRLRETRDELYERVSDLHTALEAAEKERDELKAKVGELEKGIIRYFENTTLEGNSILEDLVTQRGCQGSASTSYMEPDDFDCPYEAFDCDYCPIVYKEQRDGSPCCDTVEETER